MYFVSVFRTIHRNAPMFLLPVLLSTGLTLHAQTATIQGTVKNEKGEPLQAVTVLVKGTKTSTITNAAGNYSITVPNPKAVLVFSHVGFGKKEETLNGRTSINLSIFAVEASDLDEVIVVGYGTQVKRTITGSISRVGSEDIEKYNTPSFQSALQGRMAGVEMYESSGVPGAAVNVRIRGMNTINGSAGPLYVVDGIPVFQGGGGDGDQPQNNGVMGNSSQTNVMTDINPTDIESIEVLKDAAATAIYGARGSGGVVLITTKRGKNGKTSFNINVIGGLSQISKQKQLLDGPQLLGVLDEAYRNSFYAIPTNAGLPLPATPLPPMDNFTRGMADSTNINHLDNVIRVGSYGEVTVSAMNGTDKTKYYLSGTYKRNVSTIRGSDMNQFNFKLNIDQAFSKSVRFGVSITPSYNIDKKLGSSSTLNLGGYGGAISTNLPIYPLYNADGTYFNPYTNPLSFLNRDLFRADNQRIRINESAYLEADLSKSLKFKTLVQREDWSQKAPTYTSGLLRQRTANDIVASPFVDDQVAQIQQPTSYGYLNSIESYFTYIKTLGKSHHVNGVAGMRFSTNNALFEAMYGENFANTNLDYPSQAARINDNFQTAVQGDPSANLGYFVRAQYDFKRKYLLSAVVNRDGSSRFGSNQRFGTFPAFSAGWVISDEKFLKRNKFVSFIKLRGSFGLTGNSGGIGNYASKTTWQSGMANIPGYMGNLGNYPAQAGNANLHWEKGTKYDGGLDMEFLGGKIRATVDYYENTTTDMLLSIPTPQTYGYGYTGSDFTYLENRGSLNNKGIEFSINAKILSGKFTWNASFNISHNETQILSLGGLDPSTVSGGTGSVQLYVGKSSPVYYLIESAGVDPATGQEMINNNNGKAVFANSLNPSQLDSARRPQFDKSPAPKYYGGFGNNFSYKGFDLSIFFSYRVGNYLLDAGERVSSYVGNVSLINNNTVANVFVGNLSATVLDRWTTPGQITDMPKVNYNSVTTVNDVMRNRNSTRFLSDASFARLKNVVLSYTVTPKVLKSLGLKSLRFNLTGQNLLLFTNFNGVDPEAVTIQTNYRERNIAYGVIQNVVPQTKTLTVGLNIGF